VRSLGASELCIVVGYIQKECAVAYEKRREHKRMNGTESIGREMNIRGK
jgi:hypothetical protein